MSEQALGVTAKVLVDLRSDGSVLVERDGHATVYPPRSLGAEAFRACAGGDQVLGVPSAEPPGVTTTLRVTDVDPVTRTVTFG